MSNEDLRKSIKKYLEDSEQGIDKIIFDFLAQQITVFFTRIRQSYSWLYSKEEINDAFEQKESQFSPVNILEDELYLKILELLFPQVEENRKDKFIIKKMSVLINLAKTDNPAAYFQAIVFNTVFIAGVKKRNPEIDLLIKDIKYLIHQYPDVFIRIENVVFEMNPHILLSSDFDRKFYESLDFPGYLKTRTRRKKIFFAMVNSLEENRRLRMKDLINNVKGILGVAENKLESLSFETEENDDSDETKLRKYSLEKNKINNSNNIDFEERDLYEHLIKRFFSNSTGRQQNIYGTYNLLIDRLNDYEEHKKIKINKKKIISDYISEKYRIKKSSYHEDRNHCGNLIARIAKSEKLTFDQLSRFTQFIHLRFENQIFIDEELLDNFIKQNIKEKKAKRKKRNDR